MSEVTQILRAAEQGDPRAAEQLLPLVYEELRKLAAAKLAHEKPGQTLQATALVHEAYLRLVDVEQVQHWCSRGHFFAAAAEAVRRILIESARRKHAIRRGGGLQRIELGGSEIAKSSQFEDLIVLDDGLTKLAGTRPHAVTRGWQAVGTALSVNRPILMHFRPPLAKPAALCSGRPGSPVVFWGSVIT